MGLPGPHAEKDNVHNMISCIYNLDYMYIRCYPLTNILQKEKVILFSRFVLLWYWIRLEKVSRLVEANEYILFALEK